jgi:hypothetical protein
MSCDNGQCNTSNPKTFDGEKDGYVFMMGDVGLGYYYNDSPINLMLERLH